MRNDYLWGCVVASYLFSEYFALVRRLIRTPSVELKPVPLSPRSVLHLRLDLVALPRGHRKENGVVRFRGIPQCSSSSLSAGEIVPLYCARVLSDASSFLPLLSQVVHVPTEMQSDAALATAIAYKPTMVSIGERPL